MNQQQRFIDHLDINPKDWTTRLVYADWLEENDQPEEAVRQRRYEESYKWMEDFVKKHHTYLGKYAEEEYRDEEQMDEYFHQWIRFLDKHMNGEHWLNFDTPDPPPYSDEMWNHYEVITGRESPEKDHEYRYNMPPFSCSC